MLIKILPKLPNSVTQSIIHLDQTGFMAAKSTSINIRRMQLIVQLQESSVLASLDITKVFDFIEWPFLLAAFQSFGFGEKFQK